MADVSLPGWANGDGAIRTPRRLCEYAVPRPRLAVAACDLWLRRSLQRRQDNLLEQRQKRAHGSRRKDRRSGLHAGRKAARLVLRGSGFKHIEVSRGTARKVSFRETKRVTKGVHQVFFAFFNFKLNQENPIDKEIQRRMIFLSCHQR